LALSLASVEIQGKLLKKKITKTYNEHEIFLSYLSTTFFRSPSLDIQAAQENRCVFCKMSVLLSGFNENYIVVDKVALGQVFSEYFGFPC
jgi:hypothetical protein